MRTIFVVMDSLKRTCLRVYGNGWVTTPNIDRLVEKASIFQRHYAQSLPCIPARRDMLTGRINFLENRWGPVEPWDVLLPNLLRDGKGIYSHMITDHPHYFNGGAGDGYQTCFDSWEYLRGQPYDLSGNLVDLPPEPEGQRVYCYGDRYRHQYMGHRVGRDMQDET